METNEAINIEVQAEGNEQAIILNAPEGEQEIGSIGNESIVVRSITSYNPLDDKPSINEVTLIGDKSFEDLGAETITNLEIEAIINSVV